MARVRPVVITKIQQPWAVVLMGTPGIGKSTFMKSDLSMSVFGEGLFLVLEGALDPFL